MPLRLCSRAPEMTIRSEAATQFDSTHTNRRSPTADGAFPVKWTGKAPSGASVEAGCQALAIVPRRRVRRVAFAEDADDRAAEQLARVRVGARHLAQQGVEGGVALAPVERLEGGRGDPRLGEPDTRRDPRRGEVRLVALDRLQRLVLRPARQPRLGQRHRYVGAARLQLRRLTQGQLVALRQQLVGARRRQRVEQRLYLGLRHGADELLDDPAVAEGLHRRDALDAVAGGERLVGVDVDLGEDDLPVPRRLGGLQRRGQRPARAAPLRPEVDHDRDLAGALDHLLLEGRLADVDRHGVRLDSGGAGDTGARLANLPRSAYRRQWAGTQLDKGGRSCRTSTPPAPLTTPSGAETSKPSGRCSPRTAPG